MNLLNFKRPRAAFSIYDRTREDGGVGGTCGSLTRTDLAKLLNSRLESQ